MENIDSKVLPGQPVGKEYEIPELVDLNSIGEAVGVILCRSGSSNVASCGTWAAGPS